MTGYISLVIKLNILNHMMIIASADYSYKQVVNSGSYSKTNKKEESFHEEGTNNQSIKKINKQQ